MKQTKTWEKARNPLRRVLCALLAWAVLLCPVLSGTAAYASAMAEEAERAYTATGAYLEKQGTPGVGAVGGEWMVIGLARSGKVVAKGYYDAVVAYVQKNIDENERLHNVKATENARLILALTALGKDVTNVDGHNLLRGLNDMAYVTKQGINGAIWTLIALNAGDYSVPGGDVTREALTRHILDAQTADGGWTFMGAEADADMTGMALQALAPYYATDAAVGQAVDTAIAALSRMQEQDGTFTTSTGGSSYATSESIAQVVVALTALGIDPHTDARFVKNGNSAVDALLTFFIPGGGFRHMADSEAADGMATEQCFYALTAYSRFLEGETALYDMTDVPIASGDADEPTAWWLGIPAVILLGGAAAWVQIRKAKQKRKAEQ